MLDTQKIWASAHLPTLPAVALRLIELTRSPTTGIGEIVAAVKSDPAIVARLLKAANSTFFGMTTKVTSIEQAVLLLGTTGVTALALGFSLADASSTQGPLRDAYCAYWLQSAVQGPPARLLALRQSWAGGEDHFLTGLLLDLGELAMLRTIPGEYKPVVEAAASLQRPLHEMESQILGVSHVDIGIGLMQRWNLPDALCRAVRW